MVRKGGRRAVRADVKKALADRMRRHPTKAEALLWEALRAADLGVYLCRQKVVRGWIADIYCPAARTLIEVDGPSHLGRRASDAFRDRTLAAAGYLTVRVTNEQVYRQRPACVQLIRRELYRRLGWA